MLERHLPAPAALREPIDGQPYGQVPTEHPGVTVASKVEKKVYFGPERGPARIVHRADEPCLGGEASKCLAALATPA